MASSGKIFEQDFQSSCINDSVDHNRLKDPVGGHSGVRNICDFILYSKPNIFYMELKSRQGNTLALAEISPTQWDGLQLKREVPGAIPGVVVHYSDHNEVYFVHARQLDELKQSGAKSVNVKYAREHCISLQGTVKRVHYTYHINKFLEEVAEFYGG